jgi:hypothetical protein
MKLTRERKIFAGILVAALIALGVDQLTGSSSSDRSADAAAQADPGSLLLASSSSSSASASPKPNGTLTTYGPSLAQRLNDVAPAGTAPSLDQIRDVFRIPRGWSGAEQSAPRIVSSDKLAAERFLQVHKLSAISKSGAGDKGGADVAVVDGKLLHPGATLDGFKLVAVTRAAAVFDCDGAQVLLQLKTDAATASSNIGSATGR